MSVSVGAAGLDRDLRSVVDAGGGTAAVGLAQLDIQIGFGDRTRIGQGGSVVREARAQIPFDVLVVLEGGVADLDLGDIQWALAEQKEHPQVLVEADQFVSTGWRRIAGKCAARRKSWGLARTAWPRSPPPTSSRTVAWSPASKWASSALV
jgi:hypothetical protein